MTFFRGRPDLVQGYRQGLRAVVEDVWAYVDRVEAIVRHGFHQANAAQRVAGVPSSEVADLVQEVFARRVSGKRALGLRRST